MAHAALDEGCETSSADWRHEDEVGAESRSGVQKKGGGRLPAAAYNLPRGIDTAPAQSVHRPIDERTRLHIALDVTATGRFREDRGSQ